MKWWLVSVILITIPLATALTADDTQNLRAFYAKQLIELDDEYIIECGNADVVNTPAHLSQLIEGTNPAVCTLQKENQFRGVMFSRPEEAPLEEVIAHLINYNNPEIDDNDIIKANNINTDACVDITELSDTDWLECPDAVTGMPYDIRVYVRYTNPISYFVTVDYRPPFDDNLLANIIDFFLNLFRAPPTATHIPEFTRGYFANVNNERTVNAIYHETNTNEGTATIIFQDFSFDVSELTADADYQLGDDYRQVLEFETITVEQWKKLTASLRITPTNEDPVGQESTCGNGVLDHGEDCEPTGVTFLAPESLCSGIGYGQGSLTCNSDCTYDTSDCVSCEDIDQDGYFAAEGQPLELRAINKEPLIGALNIGVFDASNPDNEEADRSAVGLQAQVIPLPLEAFPEITDEIEAEASSQLTSFNTCLESNTENECYAQATTNLNRITAPLTALFQNKEFEATELCSNEDCTPLETGTLGYWGPTYGAFINTARGEGIEPIYLLDPGRYLSHDLGTPPTNQKYENRLRTMMTCAAFGELTRPATYIYAAPTRTPEHYLNSYNACRAGLAAVTAGDLYHNARRDEDITFLKQKAQPGLVDGLVTNKPATYVNELQELRKTIGAKLLVGTSPERTISALRASPDIIVYAYERLEEIGLANEIIINLQKPYAALPEGTPTLVDEGTPTTIYVQNNVPGTLPFDFSNCELTPILTADNTEFTDESVQYEELPDMIGTHTFTVDDWNCFLENTAFTACTGALDCNDNDATINPSAPEGACGDGIDSNCNGADDDASCGAPVGGDSCNYNGNCDTETEDVYTCADCINAPCPAEQQHAFTQGAYDFSISINEFGEPFIHWETNDESCPQLNGQMVYDPSPATAADGAPIYRVKPLSTSPDVTLVAQPYGWKLEYAGAADPCWDAGMTGTLREIHPLDYVTCTYEACSTTNPCTGTDNYCVNINSKDLIYRCYNFNFDDLYPECDPRDQPRQYPAVCP